MATGLLLAAFAFLLILTSSVVSLVREHESVRREQIRQINKNSASMVAGTMLSQLRALSDAVERTASWNDVIVQTRADEALGTEIKLAIRLTQWAGIAIAPGVLMAFVSDWPFAAASAACRSNKSRIAICSLYWFPVYAFIRRAARKVIVDAASQSPCADFSRNDSS